MTFLGPISLATILIFFPFLVLASSKRLMCGYNSQAEDRAEDGQFSISDIDPNLCTHLIYVYADIVDNKLAPADVEDVQHYINFNALKERSVL